MIIGMIEGYFFAYFCGLGFAQELFLHKKGLICTIRVFLSFSKLISVYDEKNFVCERAFTRYL